MRYARSIGTAIVIAMTFAAMPCCAEPPTPPDPNPEGFYQAMKAIDRISPFLGVWSGVEIERSSAGDRHSKVTWNVCRVDLTDVVLVFRSGGLFRDGTDVVTYDPSIGHYRMTLLGYRLSAGDDATLRSTDLQVGDIRLHWQEPDEREDGGIADRTLSVETSSSLREVTVDRSRAGVSVISEATMTRQGDSTSC